jgi:hypothetical protein
MNPVFVVLAVVFGYFGYRESEKFKGEYGSTPWGLPSIGWGVVTGFSLILGAVLLTIARRGARKSQRTAGPSASRFVL